MEEATRRISSHCSLMSFLLTWPNASIPSGPDSPTSSSRYSFLEREGTQQNGRVRLSARPESHCSTFLVAKTHIFSSSLLMPRLRQTHVQSVYSLFAQNHTLPAIFSGHFH